MLSLRILKNSLLPLLCALFAGIPTFAQEQTAANKPPFFTLEAVYLCGGAGGTFTPATGFFGSSRITAVLRNGLGVSAGIHTGFAKMANAPEGFYYSIPEPSLNRFQVVDICAVRKFWVRGAREQLRLGIEAGPALVHRQTTEYSPLPPLVVYNSSTPRYRTESIAQNAVGIQVSLNATYVPAQIIGLELALWGNINPVQPLIGLEGNFLLGRLKGSRYSQR